MITDIGLPNTLDHILGYDLRTKPNTFPNHNLF